MKRQRLAPEHRRKVLRWVAMAIALPSVAGVLLVGYFVVSTERAHDESRCPFARVGEPQVVGDITVIDERRQCTPELVEHRWLALRPGRPNSEVGRRRLSTTHFREGTFAWRAKSLPHALIRVHVTFTDPKMRPSFFDELGSPGPPQ